jgi:exopolysaccharide biosynthesis polyprenyl glycosylphosphotransferase
METSRRVTLSEPLAGSDWPSDTMGLASPRVTVGSRNDVTEPRTGFPRHRANERSVDQQVTTTVSPPTAAPQGRARAKHRAIVEETVELAQLHNGVPRTTWFRHIPRMSTWHRPYAAVLLALDYLAVALASLTAISLFPQADSGFENFTAPILTREVFELVAYVGMPAGWLIALWGHGAYDRRYLGLGSEEYKRVFRASITAAATVSFLAFAFKVNLSRLSVGTALVGALVYVVIGRVLARRVLVWVRKHGRAVHRVLLVGSFSDAMDVLTAVKRVPAAGLVPVGILLTEGVAPGRVTESPLPVFRGRELISLVRDLRADTVAVCGSARAEPAELRRLAWQLEGTGIDLVVAPQLTDVAGPRVHIRPVEGLPLLHVEEPKLSGMAWLFKNVMDRVLAAILLVLLVPVFVVIALMIKIGDRGPVFFKQSRVGLEGKVFKVIKFRTMYPDAEERLAQLIDQNESDGLLFKIRDDPRITPIGRVLRRTSLDELPQLINVLKGEMSLVGPRPLPAEDGDFLGDVRRRLLVKPGITGLWQVSGRSELSWDDAVRLDLYYVDNWSLAFDLVILWRTVGVVLARRGAY